MEDFVQTYNDLRQLSPNSQANPTTLRAAISHPKQHSGTHVPEGAPFKQEMAQLGLSMKDNGQLRPEPGPIDSATGAADNAPSSLATLLKSWDQAGSPQPATEAPVAFEHRSI